MTENALVQIDDQENPLVPNDAFDAARSGAGFTPYLKLMTSASDECKEGNFPANHYARVLDGDFRDLGQTVDVIICDWRPKAMDMSTEVVQVTYDMALDAKGKPTGQYAEIAQKADRPGRNGAMYGPEFLVYVPAQGEFMTLWMSSKTARRASASVNSQMHKAATLGSRKITNGENTWYGPTCQPCTPTFDPPEHDQLQEQIQRFRNPPKPTAERVEESDEESARER